MKDATPTKAVQTAFRTGAAKVSTTLDIFHKWK
jgi:hypothetical protein